MEKQAEIAGLKLKKSSFISTFWTVYSDAFPLPVKVTNKALISIEMIN